MNRLLFIQNPASRASLSPLEGFAIIFIRSSEAASGSTGYAPALVASFCNCWSLGSGPRDPSTSCLFAIYQGIPNLCLSVLGKCEYSTRRIGPIGVFRAGHHASFLLFRNGWSVLFYLLLAQGPRRRAAQLLSTRESRTCNYSVGEKHGCCGGELDWLALIYGLDVFFLLNSYA